MIAWLLSVAWASSPIEIAIADPKVTEVILHCGAEELRATVRGGMVSFPNAPASTCTLEMLRDGGKIDSAGKWVCTLDNCTREDVHHLPISNAPNRVNIVLTTSVQPGTGLEITCPSTGQRERLPVVENTVTFDGVRSEDCTLQTKGGMPGRYSPVKYGTYYCSLTANTLVCTLR
ncbi:MAG: hypothetical protein H0V89_03910 [Deltaproteobacteria bacterium]|nr:hypothetical protein [Deltaproteobacteria bacterium]